MNYAAYLKLICMSLILSCNPGCLIDVFGPTCVTLPLDESLDTGVRGTVTLGPTCPVEQPDQPCVEPFEADLRIECTDGSAIVTVRSDADGEFELDLPPGEYRIVPLQPDPANPFPVASEVSFVVPEEGFVEVQIDYDTGIR